MKHTIIILLFIALLLSLLIISYYGFLGKWEYFTKEGFISFESDKNPLNSDIVIPTYSPSSRVFKLYDNLFFDNTNGNLIQANGQSTHNGNTASGSTNISDSAGTTLSSIIVYNRDSSIGGVTINTQVSNGSVTNSASQQSQNTGYDVSSKFSQYIISNLNGNTTDNYQTLYIAWDKITFIDVINTSVSPPQTLLGALFSNTKLQGHLVAVPYNSNDNNLIKIVATQFVADPNDGRLNIQTWYGNNQLYQVCSFLHYDVSNGNIVLKNNQEAGTSTVRILNRQFKPVSINGGVLKGIPNVDYVVNSVQFDPSDASETPDNPKFFIYYVGFNQNTILIVLKKQVQTNDMFKIVKVARFDQNGYVDTTTSDTVKPADIKQNGIDDTQLYKVDEELYDIDAGLYGIDILLANQIDYIQKNYVKKTDMVAPIYPTVLSCPNCSNSNGGVCNNCGGNGGSGTVGTNGGNTVVGGVNNAVNGVVGLGNNIVGGTFGLGNNIVGGAVDLGKTTLDLTKQGVSGAADLTKQGVSGAADLTKQGVSGAAELTKEAVTGASNIAGNTVTGAVNLGKETVGGAVDLTKQAASGTVNELNYLIGIPGGNNGGPGYGYGGYGNGGPGYRGTGSGGPGNGGYGNAGGQQGIPINYNTSGTVPGVDTYSGYGSLVNKGSDFMPLTASFSAFGK